MRKLNLSNQSQDVIVADKEHIYKANFFPSFEAKSK